jgi:hypothetical protein
MRIIGLPVLLASLGGNAAAQVTVPREPACATCTVELRLVTTISGDRVAGEPMGIKRMADGSVLVSFYPMGNEVLAFRGNGSFASVVATTGDGPGEVRRATVIAATPSDSIAIYDSGRVLVFSPDRVFSRTEVLPVPSAYDVVYLSDGRIISLSTILDPNGSPLLRVDPSGATTSVGGEPASGARFDAPYTVIRTLATDGTRVWSVPLNRYEITEWTSSGERVRSLRLQPPLFEAWETIRPIAPGSPPDPRVSDILWVGGDTLVVLVAVPAPDWSQYLGPPTTMADGRTAYNDMETHRVFSTRIDVWDVGAARLLSSQVEPRFLLKFADQRHVAGYRQDEVGNPFIEIYQIALGH